MYSIQKIAAELGYEHVTGADTLVSENSVYWASEQAGLTIQIWDKTVADTPVDDGYYAEIEDDLGRVEMAALYGDEQVREFVRTRMEPAK